MRATRPADGSDWLATSGADDLFGPWIYRHRRHAKSLLSATGRVLPAPLSHRLRAFAEQVAFRVVPDCQSDTLPPIFDYWATHHVRPLAERIQVPSPEALYLSEARRVAAHKGRVSICSLGSGAGWLELSLLDTLRAEGVEAQMLCIDFNAALLRRAMLAADARGLAPWLAVERLDCNRPFALQATDVLIVNQFFHHVERLETFAASLRGSLADDGVLLTSDVVGRNGHVLWPAVDQVVQAFWRRLPQEQRFDRYFSERRARYQSVDHAAYSNEGVRAQDVVASLAKEFAFERFLTFGAAAVPFIERRIGFNFDPASPEDTAFIDLLAGIDGTRIAAGDYPGSNMIAVLRHRGGVAAPACVPVSPEQHIAATRRQLALC